MEEGEADLKCGELNCERCGDCIACYENDPCYDGGPHSYDERDRKPVEGESK